MNRALSEKFSSQLFSWELLSSEGIDFADQVDRTDLIGIPKHIIKRKIQQ
jgi:hypothetical protein